MKLGRAQAVTMAAALWFLLPAQGCTPAQKFNGEVVEPASQAPELTGVNWDGKPFKLSDHRGKVALVFFGYTYCPDVCPFTLAKMKQVYRELGDGADGMEVVFVSVDPKRDTVEKLSRYVPSFDRRFYGLRLEPQEIEAVSKAFDLTVQYGQPKEGPETDSFYYVDHTGTFFVIDREGRLRLKFPPNATVQQMVPDLQKLLAV
ncbi:MAG TPA: SCO family protein [Thermoanaerobaculia bacterium]|nr:SCO family protein [Thermoanaerobaculia bacterium]